MISKTFYQQLRSSERQSLVGPPESMREHVVAASKAMRNGNWKQASDYIINDKMNAKVSFADKRIFIWFKPFQLEHLTVLRNCTSHMYFFFL